ncbi:MAG: tail fiber domain-containing protein [Flavobacteriia bacterium]|nr:tail fiber domain-containing protein [Flavobacteriia bacterium]
MKKLLLLFMLADFALNAQNVGIGTSTPDGSAALDIESTDGGILVPRMTSTNRDAISSPATGLMIFNITNEQFEFYNSAAWVPVSAEASTAWELNTDSAYVALATKSDGTARSNPTAFVITDDGKLGLGTTDPKGDFSLEGATTVNFDLVTQSTNNSIRAQMRMFSGGQQGGVNSYGYNFAVGGDRFTIRDINQKADRLILNGDGRFGFGTAPVAAFRAKFNGDIQATGNVQSGGTVLTSDSRLKSNVQELTNALGIIENLSPVSYIKASIDTGSESRSEFGFLAQDVQKVLPQLVYGVESDTTYLSLDYNSFIAILTKASQEQSSLIKNQQTEIELLKERLDRLEEDEVQTAGVLGATVTEILLGVLLVVLVFRARRVAARMHTEI